VSELLLQLDVTNIVDGKEAVTFPDVAEKFIWLAVPVISVTPEPGGAGAQLALIALLDDKA
jgi:hypothetical protein